jgi:hypothetical protein
MKLFISWSGERSKVIAHSLRDWLPLVLHYVEPWLSETDVYAGDRWGQEIANQLEASNFGIVCVTPENAGAPWMLFEAGALAKSIEGSKVIPLLYELDFSDITGPLAQFQAKKVGKAGLNEVIQSINLAADVSIPEERAKNLFDPLWPQFENSLNLVPEPTSTAKRARPRDDILEELVASVRGLDSRLDGIKSEMIDQYRRSPSRVVALRRRTKLRELAISISERMDAPTAILMIGGLLRDELPWVSEVMVETYHGIEDGNPQSLRKGIEQLKKIVDTTDELLEARKLIGAPMIATDLMRDLPTIFRHIQLRDNERSNDSFWEDLNETTDPSDDDQ